VALYVLSYLEPRDLARASQTCHYWHVLAEDNLLWREKCREEGLTDSVVWGGRITRRRTHSRISATPSSASMKTAWKNVYKRQKMIENNWSRSPLQPPKVHCFLAMCWWLQDSEWIIDSVCLVAVRHLNQHVVVKICFFLYFLFVVELILFIRIKWEIALENRLKIIYYVLSLSNLSNKSLSFKVYSHGRNIGCACTLWAVINVLNHQRATPLCTLCPV